MGMFFQMDVRVLLRRLKKVTKMRRYLTRAKVILDRKKGGSSVGVSHGYHVDERDESGGSVLLAHREQLGASEIWLFEVSDKFMGDVVTKYLQSHLFQDEHSEHQLQRRAKETIKKAYVLARPSKQVQERRGGGGGCTTALVLNSERFVAADFGGYRAVVCRGGVAFQIGGRSQNTDNEIWPLNSITGKMFGRTDHIGEGEDEPKRRSGVVVVAETVKSDTEFIILASDGIWEVMQNQEAVDLIWHIHDAQEAAECLAMEALNRMSKSNISCLIIRFG